MGEKNYKGKKNKTGNEKKLTNVSPGDGLGDEELISTVTVALPGIEPRHGLLFHIQSIPGIKRPERQTDHNNVCSFMYLFTFYPLPPMSQVKFDTHFFDKYCFRPVVLYKAISTFSKPCL